EALDLFERDAVGGGEIERAERAEAADRLGAEEEIAPHAHQRNGAHILMNRGDAELARLSRAAEADFTALEQNGAAIGRMKARQYLGQRRFAGAIVAQQAQDAPRPDRERHIVERPGRAEGFADVAQFEN